MDGKELAICNKCSELIEYQAEDIIWNTSGSVDYKLVICPRCGMYNILKIEEDMGLYVNYDPRYYE